MGSFYNLAEPQLKYSTLITLKAVKKDKSKITSYLKPVRCMMTIAMLEKKGLVRKQPPPPKPKLRPKMSDLSKIDVLELEKQDEKILNDVANVEVIDLTESPLKKMRMECQSPLPSYVSLEVVDLTKTPDNVIEVVSDDVKSSPDSVLTDFFKNCTGPIEMNDADVENDLTVLAED